MTNTARILPFFLLTLSAVASGCSSEASGSAAESAEAEKKASGPCGGASEGLSGIAILEVKDDAGGAKLVEQLRKELNEECVAKGYDKSATETLGCYEKNKDKAGYRVLKGCDDKIGRELIDAVVAKHGGKKDK